MAAENIAYRLIREPVTQVGHGAHDPVIVCPWRIDIVASFERNVAMLHW